MDAESNSMDASYQDGDVKPGGGDSESPGNGIGSHQGHMMPTDDKSVEERKLFIGGLSYASTEDDLNKYFSQFGEVEMSEVKRDSTGTSRGFGFIIFQAKDAIAKVFAKQEHMISGKKVDPKQARAKTGRVFVGGINVALTEANVRDHFNQFGNVVDLQMPFNQERGVHKGFAFVTYDSLDPIKSLLENPNQTIKDYNVEVKKAVQQSKMDPWGTGGRGGRGGRGGWMGRGGWGGPAPSAAAAPYGFGGYDPWSGYGYGYDFTSYYGGWGDPSAAMGGYWGGSGQGGGKGPRGRGATGSNRQAPY